ncbi:hypothetical protein ES703_111898 [subsurface metagenome]
MPTPVFIGYRPTVEAFIPYPDAGGDTIILEPADVEVLRLVDLEDLSQEEAGMEMGVSRGTIWRLLQEARRKVTQALIEGRRIQILSRAQEKDEVKEK